MTALQTRDRRHETVETRLTGTIGRIRHQNPKTGFFIALLDMPDRSKVTVLGSHPAIFVGETMSCRGVFVDDARYGRQFKASEVETLAPVTEDGLARFLSSSGIKGIGKGTAGKIVRIFGERLPEVIEKQPKLLLDVPGMNKNKLDALLEAWSQTNDQRNALVFLYDLGVGAGLGGRVLKRYGSETVARVRANPYDLARDVRGFGFNSADQVARKLGIEPTALIRVRAGLLHVLDELSTAGHCGAPREQVVATMQDTLGVDEDLVLEAIESAIGRGDVVVRASQRMDGEMLWHAGLYAREQAIAQNIARLQKAKPAWGRIDAREAVDGIVQRTGFGFGIDQARALEMALSHPVSVVTGNPGTGKTSIVRFLIEELERRKMRIALAAPTGKAARRLSESTLRPATTIHRLLGSTGEGGFKHDEKNPIVADVVILDEASMIDVSLMASLLRAIPDRTSLVIVGDVDQLPSVGPGQVLYDVIASQRIPVTRLREIFRQAAESRIITNAFRVNAGEMPEIPVSGEASDFYYMEAADPEDAFAKVSDMVLKHIPRRFGFDPRTEIQVLCPMKTGPAGVKAMNKRLQEAFSTGSPAIERFGDTFAIGDRVIQTSNDYQNKIFNGDMGFVIDVASDKSSLVVEFDTGQVRYEKSDLDSLELAYAMTIHRSQGSEFPVVVMPVLTSHYVMLQRNLVYTGITRGKKLVVLVGQKKALGIAVRNNTAGLRMTLLGELMTHEP